MTDDTTITRFAQRYRLRAAAVLMQIAEDEEAPANARTAAVQQILGYSDGRPGQAKHVTTADFDQMTEQQLLDLFRQLLVYMDRYYPGLITQWFDAYAQASQQLGLPRPNRFTRGTPAPKLAHQPQRESRMAQPSEAFVSDSSAISGSPQRIAAPPARYARSGHAQAPEQLVSAPQLPEPDPAPNNVVPFPENSANEPPAPFGLKFGLADTLDTTNTSTTTSAAPVNGVHHSVLARSARPPGGMAMDITFRDYRR